MMGVNNARNGSTSTEKAPLSLQSIAVDFPQLAGLMSWFSHQRTHTKMRIQTLRPLESFILGPSTKDWHMNKTGLCVFACLDQCLGTSWHHCDLGLSISPTVTAPALRLFSGPAVLPFAPSTELRCILMVALSTYQRFCLT